MLVGRASYPRLSSLRHLAEITLPGCYELTNKFTNSSDIVTWVRTNTDSDVDEMNSLDIMVKFVSALDRQRFREQEVRHALLSNLIWFTEATLPYYYLKISAVKEILKGNIRKVLRDTGADIRKIDDLMYDEFLDSFSQHVRENSCNGQYNPDQGGNLTGFLVFTLNNHWGPSKSSDIFKIINSRGMFQEISGQDFSAADMYGVRADVKVDLLEFQDIATSIYKCSREIYIHGNQVIYDLFSRIKAKRASSVLEHLNDEIARFDGDKLIGKMSFKDINRDDSDKHEIRNKYTNREEILSYVDPLLVDAASVETLSEIINTVIYVAEAQLAAKSKDAYSIFSLSNEKRNYDKVFSIIAATTKLRKLLAYMQEQKINIFAVPSSIFKDARFQNRPMKSLRQYMYGHDDILEIINESPPPEAGDNTRMYGDLVEKAALNRVSAVPLYGLKAILDASRDKAVVPTVKVSDNERQNKTYLENIIKYLSTASFEHAKLNRSLRLLSDIPQYITSQNNILSDQNDGFFEDARKVRLMLVFLAAITCYEHAMIAGKSLIVNPDHSVIIDPEQYSNSITLLFPDNFKPFVARLMGITDFDSIDPFKEDSREKIVDVLRVKQTIHMAVMQMISMASICLYAYRNDWSDISLFKALTSEVIAKGTGQGVMNDYSAPEFRVISDTPKEDWGVEHHKILVLDYLKLPATPKTLVDVYAIDSHVVTLTPSNTSVFRILENQSKFLLATKQTNITFYRSTDQISDKLDLIFANYKFVTEGFTKLFGISKLFLERFDNIATSMSCSDYDVQDIPESALETAQILATVMEPPNQPGIDNRKLNKYGFFLDHGIMRPDKAKSIVGVNLYKHATGHYFYFEDGNAKLWYY